MAYCELRYILPCYLQPMQGLQQGQTFPSTIFSIVLRKTVHPSVSVPWRGMKEKVCATEVRDDPSDRIHVTTVDNVPGQLFSSGAQFDVTVRHVFRRREGHFEQLLGLCTVQSVC
jgi:hypothetical protein